MGRLDVLMSKIETDIASDRLKKFKTFIEKIDQKTFDFILNNFNFIGVGKTGKIAKEKALTFVYGDKSLTSKAIADIKVKDCQVSTGLNIPESADKIAIRFFNIYGTIAVIDIKGNLYCANIFYYCDESEDESHILFEEIIDKYKEFEFPIVYFSDALLKARLINLQNLAKEYKIDIKIVKTEIDKKTALKLLKPELMAIETSLKTTYETLLKEKNEEIARLKQKIDELTENSLSESLKIIAKLEQKGFKLTIEKDRLLIDCSNLKVTKLKKNYNVYILPEDCQIFNVGIIALPFDAQSLSDCYTIEKTSFHPNIDHRPCFGNYYKIADIAEAIEQFETINLDAAYENEAYFAASELFEELSNENIEFTVWRSDE